MTDIGTVSGGIEINTQKAFDPVTRLYDLLDKFANTSVPKVTDSTAKLQTGLDRLAASLDPVVAGEQKLEAATKTLDAALKQNLIDQDKYNQLLDKAKEKYGSAGQGSSLFSQLLGKLGSVTGEGGELVARLTEHVAGLGEKLEKLGEDGGSVTSAISGMVASFAEFIPLLLAAAAAAVAFGAGFAAFDFLKDAIVEGLKTQQVIEQLNVSIAANGAAAGRSSADIVEYAKDLAFATATSKDAILQGLLLETRFTKIGHDVFPQVAEAAINMSKALPNKSVEESFMIISRAMQEAGRGLTGLKDAGITLLPTQKAYLLNMLEQGKVTEYQNEILKLLKTHLGDAAEMYARTLPGAIQNSKNALAEFKEGISSALIPVLEDLGGSLILSIGHAKDLRTAWKNIGDDAKSFGDKVGNFLRDTILGWGLNFVELELRIDHARLTMLQWRKDASTFKIGNTEIGIGEDVSKRIDAITKSLYEEGTQYAKIQDMLLHPKSALTGSDNKPPPNIGGDVEKKTKAVKDYHAELDAADKAVRTFNDHLADQEQKASAAADKQQALSDALSGGIVAYNLEVLAQQKASAIETALAKLTSEHRAEIEKLTDTEKKLNEAHRPDLAQKVADQIEIANRLYDDQILDLAIVTGGTIDLTQANALRLTQLKGEQTYQDTLHTAQAELKDSLADITLGYVHSTAAVKANSLELAINKALLANNAIAGLPFAAAIAERVTSEAKEVDTLHALTAAAKERLAIDQLQLKIDQDQASAGDTHLQGLIKLQNDIKAEIAATPKDITDQHVIDDWAAKIRTTLTNAFNWKELFDKAYAPLKELGDGIASGFSSIVGNYIKTGKASFQDFENVIVDSFASSVSKMISEWLTTWFEAMASWLARWIATQAVAKAVSAAGSAAGSSAEGADYTGAVTSTASSAAWSAWAGSGSTGAAGGSGGGMGALFSGTGSYGAVGMVGAWIVALAAFGYAIDKLDNHMKGTEADAINLGKTLDVSMPANSGGAHINMLVAEGKQLAYQIQQFFTSYNGIFESLDSSIGVKRRGQGSNTEWKVYADGIVTSFGKDMNAALGYALIEAVKHSSSTGLDPLVVAAIKDYAGKDLAEFQKEVDFAQRLATQNLPGISGQMAAASQQYFNDLHQAQTQFKDDLAALNDAATSIAQKFNDTVNQIKYATLGIDTSTSDFLAGLVGFQAQVSKTSDQVTSQLQGLLDQANQQLAAMGSGPKAGKLGNDSSDNATIQAAWDKQNQQLKDQVAKYTDELAKVPKALSDSQVNMSVFDQLYKYLQGNAKYAALAAEYAKENVDEQFDLIKLQLIALDKWEQFAGMWTDALAAAEHSAETQARQKPGGGSGPSADDKKSFDQSLKDIASQGLDPASKALYDYKKQLADLAEQQKKDKAPIADYQAAIAELDKEFKKGLLATAKGYAGTSLDSFSQKLQDGQKFFADLEAMGRLKSGIPDWLEKVMKGEFLDDMKKDWQSRVDAFRGMTNPMDAIRASSKTLTDDLHALAVATGMTADQVKAAEAEIAQGAEFQRQNAVNGILDNLFQYLQNDASYAGQAAALKKQELQIQFTIYEYQLRSLNAWTDATAQLFHDAEAAAIAAADASASASSAAQSAASINQSQDPWALLKQYTDAALDPLTVQLNKINTDFSYIRLYLGNTAEVWAAETNAIHAAFKQAENGLDTFYNSLNNGAASSLTIDQQFKAAQQTYEATLAEVQAGNYTHLGDLNTEAQTLIGLGGQEYGTSTGGFTTLRMDILSELQPILALAGITANPITGTVGSSSVGGSMSALSDGITSMVSSTDNVSSVIQSAASRQESLLTQILLSLQASGGNGPAAANRANRVQTYGN